MPNRAPAEFFSTLWLAVYYFRLIFGSAEFTRTGENSAKLRLKAEKCSWNAAKTIWLKQGL